MYIYLKDHNYKYAIEQMLLTLFPAERPNYPESEPSDGSDYLISEMNIDLNAKTIHSWAVLCINRRISKGDAEEHFDISLPEKGLIFDRIGQKIVKLAFFRAAQVFLVSPPPWGSITGVHPAKIAARYMEENRCLKENAALYLQNEYSVSPERAVLCADAAAAELDVRHKQNPGDISLYIGIPFCPTRCAYCSFVSQSVEKSMNLIEPYLTGLFHEIEAAGVLARDSGLEVKSVYIGGGTPTTLSASQLSKLMSKITASFDLSRCIEYTVEAGRPDTITSDKLVAIEHGGATRISINPQSMNDNVLSSIGRRHTAKDILDCYKLARSRFHGAVNMDLIAGLMMDSVNGFTDSLKSVIGLAPENITVHTFTAKRGSNLTSDGVTMRHVSEMPSAVDVSKMLDFSLTALSEAGYSPYYLYRQKFSSGGFENVGWCRDGYESLYNIVMMEEIHTVLSLGAGGVTKLVDTLTGKIKRITNKKYPKEYIESIDEIIKSKNYLLDFLSGTKKHLQSNYKIV